MVPGHNMGNEEMRAGEGSSALLLGTMSVGIGGLFATEE